jgi:hypothetical protein
MEETVHSTSWKLPRSVIVVGVLLAFIGPALGRRGWWLAPILVFVGSLALMRLDRSRPIGGRGVLTAAGFAVAVGALLKLIDLL